MQWDTQDQRRRLPVRMPIKLLRGDDSYLSGAIGQRPLTSMTMAQYRSLNFGLVPPF